MALRSSSSSFTYDVFLNFRGSDTRHGFTGNLYKALCGRGIHTFMDDEELQSGKEITPSLTKAIEESKIAITVLSKHYASSSFCLDELAIILHCAKSKGLLVLPVFYNVDPSEVRHQEGCYGEALAKHEGRFKDNHNVEKLEKWKIALHQVANFSGYHFKHGDGYEYEFNERIVEWVSSKINRAPLHVEDNLVGLESQVQGVRILLDIGSDDVHMIGIYGIGGLGKTTLALAVYNLIAEDFDGSCFLKNVREKSKKHGLEHLQRIILREILEIGEKEIKLASEQQGASMIQYRLQQKKVLLILDDVDKLEQLHATAGGVDWFGPKSRVIITTRNKQLLASHEVKRTYEVKELNKNDALQLLKWKAFKTQAFDPSYEEVLDRVVTYASGLPLALEVIGSSLFGKSIEEWKSAINQYKRIPNHQILEKLKVSFDSLGEEEKNVFLDIACCFKGRTLIEVEEILCAHYGHCMKYHIGVLVEKSLVKLSQSDCVTLHDLIEDMGEEIVRQESPKEPGKRSRLWLLEDIRQVLKDNTGTSAIEIIYLDFPIYNKEEIVEWNRNAFKKMKNLKTLVIRNCKFSKGPKYLPNSLRVLEWWRYPSHCLPSDWHTKKWWRYPSDPLPSDLFTKKLSMCKLPYSCFTSFDLDGLSKMFMNLRLLNFDMCKCIKQIPDVSGLPNLEELSFEYCQNLVKVHDSIGLLLKLKILSASGCRKLKRFPPLKLTSLEQLDLSLCSSLKSFPQILAKMEKLRELWLCGTPIKELPFSFQNLIGLQELRLRNWGIVQIPSSIFMLPQLTEIDAKGFKGWQWLKQKEDDEKVEALSSKLKLLCATECNLCNDFFSIDFMWFVHVKELILPKNNFTILPECIKDCQLLRYLDVSDCQHLQEIRGIPPNIKHLLAKNCNSLTSSSTSMFLKQELHEAGDTWFLLPGARIPEWFDYQSKEPSISFWFRNKFPDKVLCLVIASNENDSGSFRPVVIINGIKSYPLDNLEFMTEMDHTCLFDLRKIEYRDNPHEVPLKNEWNHVEVTYAGVINTSILKARAIHVFRKESNMEDIQFADPNLGRKN